MKVLITLVVFFITSQQTICQKVLNRTRTITLKDNEIGVVFLKTGRTTLLTFPVKPTKVILGNHHLFSIQYVKNDIALSPLTTRSYTNLFVYLHGRRFVFDLRSVSKNYDELIFVRDFVPKFKGRNEN